MQLGQIKIIPKVRKCNFSQFKNRYKAEEEGICAIDVLECGNYLDEEIDKEFKLRQTLPHKKAKNRSQDARLPRLIGLEKGERPSDFKMVLRIRIQSPRLLAILARVMQESWESRPRTFYRGFSPLVYFHPQVLEVLRDLKVKYGGSDTDRTPRVGSDKESEPQEPSEIQIAHDSPEALAELQCYVDYMESEVLPLYSQFEKLDSTSNCKIRFKDLWYLFRPGELAYRPIGAGENKTSSNLGLGQRVWRIISVRPPLADYRITSSNHRNFFGDEEEDEHKTSFGVQGYYIDYTGDEFCVVTENFEIQPYHGERPIDTLKIFPIRFVANHQEQLRFMTGHGRHFIRTLKTRHATYNWWTITKSPRGNPTTDAEGNILKRSEYIDSEVIVDFVEAFQTNPSWKPTPSILKAESDPDQTTALDPFLINWWSDRERTKLLYQTDEVVVLRSAATSYERNVNLGRDPFLVHVRENDKNNRLTTAEYLTEQDMALLPSRLFAYVLRDRRFVQLDITRLGPVKKSADAFDCLKIKRRYKDMIQSLVDDHFDKKALDRKDGVERATLDWIKGKGKGLFILFHGAPGVGKTATAEAVAQANGKPLFSITCGDLGLTPGDVEVALQRIFRLANTWDCVLLLDEVDTFFSQRTRGDSNLAKNALVSVFLRVLEYYDGLLFLTTNRPGTLDEAFKSRIHLTLYYPPLDFSQTMDIWQLNIDRLRIVERERCRETTEGKHNHHDAEILRFAEERYSQNNGRAGWNGRQIRNAFQIASSLAHFDARRDNTRPRLTIDHFKMIQLVTEDFDRFMQETVGKTDAEQ
ncbi:P-loop containing nucleoside triphosphate hydrolase protein, partial [Thozetella sp. PMI_491]